MMNYQVAKIFVSDRWYRKKASSDALGKHKVPRGVSDPGNHCAMCNVKCGMLRENVRWVKFWCCWCSGKVLIVVVVIFSALQVVRKARVNKAKSE